MQARGCDDPYFPPGCLDGAHEHACIKCLKPISHAGFYELSKVYKRAGEAAGLRELLTTVQADSVPLKEGLLQDLEAWLEKQGV